MQQSFMKTRPVLPLVLSMSLPMVLSMMVTSLYNIVDSYLDNDLAGRVNARKIKALLKSDQRFSKIRVSVNPPRSGKDYNEKLQRTLQAIREEKHASRQKQAAVSI